MSWWEFKWERRCGRPRFCLGGSRHRGLHQTSGSIVSPSERNNIVGIKPTVGLTSRHLVVPVSEHQDTVGPMARTVKDAVRLLQVLAGPDENDQYTLASPYGASIPNYLSHCNVAGLRGKRIGIARNVINGSPIDISQTLLDFESAICVMKDAGAIIIGNTDFTHLAEWKKREYNCVTRADFATNIVDFLNKLEHNPSKIDSVESIRSFTRCHPAEDYPKRNTSTWDTIMEKYLSNKSPEFESLYQKNLFLGGEGGVLGALESHNLDAIALPTTVAYEIPALVGSPIITVPLGTASADTAVTMEPLDDVVEMAPGIPFGISFLGAKWSESTLIEIAFSFEQNTLVRKNTVRPKFSLLDGS
ncbi:amidase signature domain-containing protein [Fusarium acuminatum]|uniref:Amidase signature domain-containing protein n=1 Tax=Fusarium acuminatum TaxID=5515 RepID=A0ABZ2WP53_9HYPO